MAVLDKEAPGRFICGIECDGVAYHESETARDRDRLRQQVLEGRGWDIHRIWSTDWFKDRNGQIQRIRSLIDSSKEKAKLEHSQERQAKESIEQANEAFVEQLVAGERPENGYDTSRNVVSYMRPTAEPYKVADRISVAISLPLLESPTNMLARVITDVVEVEAPIHLKDLSARVASFWGQRAGSAVIRRVSGLTRALSEIGTLQLRGDFVWKLHAEVKFRSRKDVNIPPERIAPEEIQNAIVQILDSGASFERRELVNEVRSIFGFQRTGPALQQAIDVCIERLLSNGTVGEGSIGIALRKTEQTNSSC
jgi:hypothetical protein